MFSFSSGFWSTLKDNICDAIKDNRVDPDCKEGVDPDDTVIYEEKITKKHKESNKIVYSGFSVFSLILAGMVIIVLKRFKKKAKIKINDKDNL